MSEQNLNENNLMDVQPASEAALQETNTTPSNIPLGVLGAVLGAALGALVWIGVYQLGYMASLCGLLMFFLAMKGYGLLGRKVDKVGILLSAVIAFLMIYLAVYLSWTVSIFLELKELEMNPTMEAALEWMKLILSDKEAKGDFMQDLLSGYWLGVLGTVPTVIRHFKNVQ